MRINHNARGRLQGEWGRNNVHLAVPGTPAVFSGIVAGPEGSQKAPQGSPDDGSEGFPNFGLILDDVMSYFTSENDLKNEFEIVKNCIFEMSIPKSNAHLYNQQKKPKMRRCNDFL